MADRTTNCAVHGLQPETFVCQHLVASLLTGEVVGMCWPRGSDQQRPDAWCLACERKRESVDGEWTDSLLQDVHVTLICGACYDRAKHLNYPTGV